MRKFIVTHCISMGKINHKYFVRLIYFLLLQLTRNTNSKNEQKVLYVGIPGEMLSVDII